MGQPAVSFATWRRPIATDGLVAHDVRALGGVTFRVERGEIFGLLGPNGAGKTTLIKILLGIVERTGGEATLLGGAAGDRRNRRRRGLSAGEQSRAAASHWVYGAGVLWRAERAFAEGSSAAARRIVEARRPGELGRCERAQVLEGDAAAVGTCQALLHEPELLILDEPTDGVDPVGRSEMRSLLVELKQAGKTIFLNSHHLQEIELVCDRVAIMQRGRVRREGRVSDLTLSPRTEVYLTLVGEAEVIRRAVGSRGIVEWQSADAGHHEITVRIEDQAGQQPPDRCAASGGNFGGGVGAASADVGGGIFGGAGRRRAGERGVAVSPYLAILKDSFREAFASRVLWIVLGLATLILIILAGFGLAEHAGASFTKEDISDALGLYNKIAQQAAGRIQRPASASGRWWMRRRRRS